MIIHFFLPYLTHFFLVWEMLQTRVVDKIKTHILSSVTFFPKSCCSWDNVEKYYRTRQASNDNMAHAHCMLIRKATNSEFVIGTAIPQQQWHLNVTSYMHCLSCLVLVFLQLCRIIHEGLYVKCLLLLFNFKQN
jgi:hypothetical protein